MTLDGLTLHFVVKELETQIIGCRIDKIHQPRPDTVILALRAPGKNISTAGLCRCIRFAYAFNSPEIRKIQNLRRSF